MALAGKGARNSAVELKDAIRELRQQLEDRAIDAEELLEPLTAPDLLGRSQGHGGIVILRSPSVMKVYQVSTARPLVRVDDHFDVRTVLSVAARQRSFYLLALSQNRMRILQCTESSSREIAFPEGFPSSLAEAMQTRKPDHVLDNRASGGPSMGAGGVMFGTSSDQDDKDEYLLHFFMEIDRAAKSILKGSGDPLIPVGVEHEIALYKRVNTYPHLLEPGIHGAPDGLEGGEMHRRALQLLEEREQEPGREVPADFDKRVGTGRASIHIQEIVAAAYDGRVSHLYFQINAEYMGTYDHVRQLVKHTDDPLHSPVDLIDAAAQQTILQGGEAKILPASAMPNGVPVCALFRYAAVQNTAEAGAVETTRES